MAISKCGFIDKTTRYTHHPEQRWFFHKGDVIKDVPIALRIVMATIRMVDYIEEKTSFQVINENELECTRFLPPNQTSLVHDQDTQKSSPKKEKGLEHSTT